MKKILIIEDEKTIQEELAILIHNQGYQAISIEPKFAVEMIKNNEYDLLLLDINLPDIDGFSICTQIRKFSELPIIFITGRNTSTDELHALNIGGDDYICKPYNTSILIARIQAILRRNDNKQSALLEYKGITLDIITGEVKFGNDIIRITKNEIKILYFLMTHKSQIVSRTDLVDYLWDNEVYIDDNTLSVNIKRLRTSLASIGIDDLIQTKRGMGYQI